MEKEGEYLLAIIVGLVIVLLIAIFVPSPEDLQNARSNLTPELAIDYVPGAGKFANTVKDMDTDTVKIDPPMPMADGYLYTIHIGPKLKVQGTGQTNVIAVVRFKDETAKAQNTLGDGTLIARGGEVMPAELVAEIKSVIPPIREYTNGVLYDRNSFIVKSSTGGQILVTPYMEYERDSVAGIPTSVFKKCKVTFEVVCGDNSPKYTEAMRGCDTERPLDCVENVELCGAVAQIRLLDRPDCDNRQTMVDITYDGSSEFNIGEIVSLSFWRDTECTRNYDDYFALTDFCCAQKDRCDRIGGEFKLKAALIP